jgi:hypothetical protein
VRRATAINAVPHAETVAAIEGGIGTRRASLKRPLSDRATLRRRRQGCPTIVELSAVKLVAVFKGWQVARIGGQGAVSEVGMLQRIDRIDPCPPVQLEELSQE